jgi:hypothetical protein
MRKSIVSISDVADADLDSVTGGTFGLLANELQDSLVRGGVGAAGDDNWVSAEGEHYFVYPDSMYYPAAGGF